MSTERYIHRIRMIFPSFLFIFCFLTTPLLAERKNVIIGGLSWSGSTAIEHVMKYVLEEKIGVDVKIKQLSQSIIWPSLEKGSVDIYPEIWLSAQEAGYNKYVVKRKTVEAQLSYDNAPLGIYMPAAIAEKYKIKTVFDLQGKEKMFDTNGNGKGEMWVGPFDWGASEIFSSKIKEYGLDLEPLKVQQWVFLATLKEAMRTKKPLLFFYWEPEWVMSKYKLLKLKEPAYEKEKFIYVKGKPEQTSVSVASKPDTVYVGISKKLKKRLPKAYKFFKNWYMPIGEVSSLIANLEEIPDNPKQDAKDVAKKWVESHPEILANWMKGI